MKKAGVENWHGDIPPGLEYGLRHYGCPRAVFSEVASEKSCALTALWEDLVIWQRTERIMGQ